MSVKAIKVGLSGGTAASILNIVKEATGSPELRKELANPYSLCGEGSTFTARQKNTNKAMFDSHFNAWTAPFIMSGINTRVVHRSNRLLNESFARNIT